jgi:excinuclease ABC subunit C
MNLEEVKKLNVPTGPGSYQYYDKTGKIIYVGKAANLRSRVLSYWRPSATLRTGDSGLTPAKKIMLEKIAKIKWIETETEIEALLLEANLVKKYQPYFNVDLKDDKRYAYIKISTEDEWPRVVITRNLFEPRRQPPPTPPWKGGGISGRYFGPFTSSEAVREVLKIIRKIWRFRSCAVMPKKVCLYYRIGQCPGMCEYPVSHPEYLKTTGEIAKFLEGKRKDVERDLRLEIRDLEKKLMAQSHDNTPRSRQSETTPLDRGDLTNVEEKIRLLKYRLANLKKVLENSRILSVGEKYAADVFELAKTLNLPKVPQRIEGYDISNIFGKEAVGSMVVFADGEPDKKEYRKFKIRGAADKTIPSYHSRQTTPSPSLERRGDDTAMLKEIIERRFHNDWPLPDLLIIDGGKGQLNAGLSILKKLKLAIPILAVSKGEGLRSAHAPDKIFFPGMKTALQLPLASPALHIIKRVRDEAHRFAIQFHRARRSKSFFNSTKRPVG